MMHSRAYAEPGMGGFQQMAAPSTNGKRVNLQMAMGNSPNYHYSGCCPPIGCISNSQV